MMPALWAAIPPRVISSASAVALFAVAMAYVESACVLYLRTLYGGIDPVVRAAGATGTTGMAPAFRAVEVGREAATMVMLASVGWMAGTRLASRIGYFIAAFGIWDIFYYVWLWVFSGWPSGLLDWDVLFLIPLPWWGPVLSPTLIAAEMAVGGLALAWLVEKRGRFSWSGSGLALVAAGVLILLVTFMWDAFADVAGLVQPTADPPYGISPVPSRFLWGVYVVGNLLAVMGLARLLAVQRDEQAPASQAS
jgi:hypothetical protein